LDGNGRGGVRFHAKQEQAWTRCRGRRSNALAAELTIRSVSQDEMHF
jgi:hypothetical protein